MNTSFMKRGLWAMALLVTLAGSAMAQEVAPSDPLALDAEAIKGASIVLDKVTARALNDELKAPGEVKVDAYSTVLVSPRVESQVLARKARLGDVVKTGQPLVVLSSVQVAETQGALIVAEQDWQRIVSLGPQAVSARRYNEAKVQRDQARAKLRAYGLSEGQIGGLLRKGSAGADGSFELLAPAVGEVRHDRRRDQRHDEDEDEGDHDRVGDGQEQHREQHHPGDVEEQGFGRTQREVGALEHRYKKFTHFFRCGFDLVKINIVVSVIGTQADKIAFIANHINQFVLPKQASHGRKRFAFFLSDFNRNGNVFVISETEA